MFTEQHVSIGFIGSYITPVISVYMSRYRY